MCIAISLTFGLNVQYNAILLQLYYVNVLVGMEKYHDRKRKTNNIKPKK